MNEREKEEKNKVSEKMKNGGVTCMKHYWELEMKTEKFQYKRDIQLSE